MPRVTEMRCHTYRPSHLHPLRQSSCIHLPHWTQLRKRVPSGEVIFVASKADSAFILSALAVLGSIVKLNAVCFITTPGWLLHSLFVSLQFSLFTFLLHFSHFFLYLSRSSAFFFFSFSSHFASRSSSSLWPLSFSFLLHQGKWLFSSHNTSTTRSLFAALWGLRSCSGECQKFCHIQETLLVSERLFEVEGIDSDCGEAHSLFAAPGIFSLFSSCAEWSLVKVSMETSEVSEGSVSGWIGDNAEESVSGSVDGGRASERSTSWSNDWASEWGSISGWWNRNHVT